MLTVSGLNLLSFKDQHLIVTKCSVLNQFKMNFVTQNVNLSPKQRFDGLGRLALALQRHGNSSKQNDSPARSHDTYFIQ